MVKTIIFIVKQYLINQGCNIYTQVFSKRNKYLAINKSDKLKLKFAYSYFTILQKYLQKIDFHSWLAYKRGLFPLQQDAVLCFFCLLHSYFIICLFVRYVKDSYCYINDLLVRGTNEFEIDLIAFEVSSQEFNIRGYFRER